MNSPGTNLSVNNIAFRYAHLENPRDPDGWQEGDDVPLYMWLLNQSDTEAEIVSVTSPLASDVVLNDGELPLTLPPEELLELGPEGRHFVMQDIDYQIFGQEFVPVQVTLGDGTEVEFDVEAVDADISATPTFSP